MFLFQFAKCSCHLQVMYVAWNEPKACCCEEIVPASITTGKLTLREPKRMWKPSGRALKWQRTPPLPESRYRPHHSLGCVPICPYKTGNLEQSSRWHTLSGKRLACWRGINLSRKMYLFYDGDGWTMVDVLIRDPGKDTFPGILVSGTIKNQLCRKGRSTK